MCHRLEHFCSFQTNLGEEKEQNPRFSSKSVRKQLLGTQSPALGTHTASCTGLHPAGTEGTGPAHVGDGRNWGALSERSESYSSALGR